jgi:hypothetical protein
VAKIKPRKRRPGPPPTGRLPMVGVKLADEVIIKIDDWADKHGIPTRSEAIRVMINKALEGCPAK